MARLGVRLFARSILRSDAGEGSVAFPTYVVALWSPMLGTTFASAPNSFFWCMN